MNKIQHFPSNNIKQDKYILNTQTITSLTQPEKVSRHWINIVLFLNELILLHVLTQVLDRFIPYWFHITILT